MKDIVKRASLTQKAIKLFKNKRKLYEVPRNEIDLHACVVNMFSKCWDKIKYDDPANFLSETDSNVSGDELVKSVDKQTTESK